MRLLLLLSFLSVAVADVSDDDNIPIKCYVCDSTKDSRCADPFDRPADLLLTCPGEYTCIKKKFTDPDSIERCCSCNVTDTRLGCCAKRDRSPYRNSYCFADGCNGSNIDL
ncbi:uncharacterized protein LOC124595782 [Schistocerca americana]|uniref:uncharacterized protein LOC124595782 n=1 Tax=Schistocerca americana TaxID=7009 RepID=UPI001F4FB0EC|nr:uncharacterized protein LOC124595782 [Schistocerca americana]